MAHDDAADHPAIAATNRDRRPPLRAEMPLQLKEGGIHILRAMRSKQHHGHECQQIEEQLPVGGYLPPMFAPTLAFALLPNLRFLHFRADQPYQQKSRQAAKKKKRAPPKSPVKKEEAQSRQHVSGSVALLEQPGEHASPARRGLFHHQG